MSEYAASWPQTSRLPAVPVQFAPSSNDECTRSSLRRSHVDGAANTTRLYLPPVSVALIRAVEPSTVGATRSAAKANLELKVAPPSELIAKARLRVPPSKHLSPSLAWLRAAAYTRPSSSSVTLISCGLIAMDGESVAPRCHVVPWSSL